MLRLMLVALCIVGCACRFGQTRNSEVPHGRIIEASGKPLEDFFEGLVANPAFTVAALRKSDELLAARAIICGKRRN